MPEEGGGDAPAPPGAEGGAEGGMPPEGAEGEVPAVSPPDETTYPEELELAKLAIRALYFNISTKNVSGLKYKSKDGHVIPLEKLSDYFEETKDTAGILGFVEWVMNRYEGGHSKWTEDPEVRGKNIIDKVREFKKSLSPEEQLDNGKRVYWARIILNCLLRGTSDFNINISDVNEQSIKEIFRLLKQNFGNDTRGILVGHDDLRGPGTF